MNKFIEEKTAKVESLKKCVQIPFRLTFFDGDKIVRKNVLSFDLLEQIVNSADTQFTTFRGYNYQKEGFDILIDDSEVKFSFKQYGILRYIYDKVHKEICDLKYQINCYKKHAKAEETEDEME